jgi:hypothetical protein
MALTRRDTISCHKDFQPPNVAPEIRFLFQNEITDHFNITYNAGAERDG